MDAKRHFGILKSPAKAGLFLSPRINSGSYRLEGDAAQKEYLRFIPLAGFLLLLCPKEIRSALAAVWLPGGTGFLIGNMISGCASFTWISFMVLFPHTTPAGNSKQPPDVPL